MMLDLDTRSSNDIIIKTLMAYFYVIATSCVQIQKHYGHYGFVYQNKPPTFLLWYANTNEKTVKIDSDR